MGEGDQGAGIVEQVDEQEGEDHRDQADMDGARKIHLQEHRGDRRRHVEHAAELLMPGDDRDDGHDQDADDHAAQHPAVLERHDQREAQRRHHDRPALEVAVLHQRRRIADHDAGVLERDQRQEQADAGGDRHLERLRDGVDDPFADRQHADDEEDDAGDEDAAQRHLPGKLHAADHGEGEVGVEPHARRQRDRVVGQERHQQAADRRGDAGRDEHGAERHAGFAEDVRVDEDDVGHGQEGRDPGHDLRPHRRLVLVEFEQSFEHQRLPR